MQYKVSKSPKWWLFIFDIQNAFYLCIFARQPYFMSKNVYLKYDYNVVFFKGEDYHSTGP